MHVIIIGAGIIGAAIAEELAIRGAEVSVIDMRGPGRGASWASAGLLAPYTEADPASPLLAMGVRSLSLFDAFIARVRERSGRHVEYARTGTLEVAMTPEEAAHLTPALSAFATTNAAPRWIDPEELLRFEPQVTPATQGALFVPAHGFVDVPSLVAALVQSARLAGASFEAPAQAATIDTDRDGVTVVAGTSTRRADHVVVAAGTWSSRVRFRNVAALPVRPVRGQLLRLAWPGDARPARVVWTTQCYTVPWSDGTLLVGATSEDVGFDESTTATGVQTLLAAAIRALPAAATARLIDVRAGLRPASADGLPYIGARQRTPRVTFATGHFRNGILLAPLTAAMVASSVLDDAPDAMEQWTSPNRLEAQ